jgi:hypothetical protein
VAASGREARTDKNVDSYENRAIRRHPCPADAYTQSDDARGHPGFVSAPDRHDLGAKNAVLGVDAPEPSARAPPSKSEAAALDYQGRGL